MIQKSGNRYLLTNRSMSYGFEIASNRAVNLYWGAPLAGPAEMPTVRLRQCFRHCPPDRAGLFCQEYPSFGGKFFNEPALKATFNDGIRASFLEFVRDEIRENELVLYFRDIKHPLEIELHYHLHDELLERFAVLTNSGKEPVRLEQFYSAVWQMPATVTEWRLTELHGRWAKEETISRQRVNQGQMILESRTGLTGPYHAPFFALDDGTAGELSGELFFGTILWSGNWRMVIDRDGYDHTAVAGGINPFDSAIDLAPGERFETPAFLGGFTGEGFSGMSRIFHRYQERELLPPEIAGKELPMLTNTWGSLGFNVNEENVIATAEKAARIGSELFVIDDGWQHALGDWYPDPVKFPRGLKPVIETAAQMGMQFGLWVEPESFELASDLYKAHPEWAMRYPGCEPDIKIRHDIGRSSAMLDLAKKEVAEYIYKSMHDLVASTGIRYLKLDMNCYFSSPGSSPRLWIDYARNLDWIFQTLSRDFPGLLLENCASGAARISLQMTKSFGRINRSDNQDPLDMACLHEGFTYLNLSRMAGGACHISDSMADINHRHAPMKFQAYCGFLGSLACGKPLPECSEAELDEIAGYVSLYKKLRPVLHRGELYRLASMRENRFAVYEYVLPDKSQAAVIVLGGSQQFQDRIPPCRIPGLDENAVYSIECFGGHPGGGDFSANVTEYPARTGRALAQVGLQFELLGDFDCRAFLIQKTDPCKN